MGAIDHTSKTSNNRPSETPRLIGVPDELAAEISALDAQRTPQDHPQFFAEAASRHAAIEAAYIKLAELTDDNLLRAILVDASLYHFALAADERRNAAQHDAPAVPA